MTMNICYSYGYIMTKEEKTIRDIKVGKNVNFSAFYKQFNFNIIINIYSKKNKEVLNS
jgi:hypothetical protein